MCTGQALRPLPEKSGTPAHLRFCPHKSGKSPARAGEIRHKSEPHERRHPREGNLTDEMLDQAEMHGRSRLVFEVNAKCGTLEPKRASSRPPPVLGSASERSGQGGAQSEQANHAKPKCGLLTGARQGNRGPARQRRGQKLEADGRKSASVGTRKLEPEKTKGREFRLRSEVSGRAENCKVAAVHRNVGCWRQPIFVPPLR